MTGRKRMDDIETGAESLPRDEPGGNLSTALAVSGLKVARTRFRLWCGTWEPVAPIRRPFTGCSTAPRSPEGGPQVAGTARGRVPMRGTGTDRLVVAMRPSNAGGAKGTSHPGLFGGQS
jgi:hypothetical protein